MAEIRASFTLNSDLESVNKAESIANEYAGKLGFGEEDTMKISMAVREAAVNAVLHGNAYDPAKHVQLSFDIDGARLMIKITDQGKGLDPANVPDPLAPENLLKQSGRGIFLMKTFMDEVKYRDLGPGTELTLIKHVPSGPADGKEDTK